MQNSLSNVIAKLMVVLDERGDLPAVSGDMTAGVPIEVTEARDSDHAEYPNGFVHIGAWL